jgi:hypothetical protein
LPIPPASRRWSLVSLLFAISGPACVPAAAQLDVPEESAAGPRPGTSPRPGAGPTRPGEPGGSGGSGGGGTPAGGGGGTPAGGGAPATPTSASLLPTRVRRLSNFEYDRTLVTLLGVQEGPAKGFADDFRQSDFTQNASQQVDATFATQLQGAARDLAKPALQRLMGVAGCQASEGEACATKFINNVGLQFYRRPVTDAERMTLLSVFRAGAKDATFLDGVELVVQAMLQSPNFLYVTELGGTPDKGVVRLTDWETASALSYLVTGGPPDQPLLTAAMGGKLRTAAEREAQARRLLMQPGARLQVARLVKEWLGVDRLFGTGKDKAVYPKYDELRPAMMKEADAFIAEVVFNDDGTLTKLLTADYTVVEPALAQFYGIGSAGANRRSSFGNQPRRGILMQSAFQAVHAHDHESAPVKRGNVLLKKVLGVIIPPPGELNLMIVPPAPDPKKTTRERFAQHSTDPACAGCHSLIDPLGFVYENIDGMGGLRTTESGKPVDTKVEVTVADLEGRFEHGADLAGKLAESVEVHRSFARHLFRFAAAQSGEGYEALWFESVWDKLPAAKKVDLKELLVAFATSDLFVARRIP